MRVGPSEPAYRSRLQTTSSCCGQKPWWWALRKSRGIRSRQVEFRETSASEPFDEASKADFRVCSIRWKEAAIYGCGPRSSYTRRGLLSWVPLIPLQKLPVPVRFSPGGLGKDPYLKDFFLDMPLHLLYEYGSSYKVISHLFFLNTFEHSARVSVGVNSDPKPKHCSIKTIFPKELGVQSVYDYAGIKN
jgi:hypothetical protein